jgi:hypothetical protein
MLRAIRALIVLLVLAFTLFLVIGCSAAKRETAGTTQEKSLRVFKPDELLSEAEAVELTGHPVTLSTKTLAIDPKSGTSTTYYQYDIGKSTLMAMFMLVQNSAAKKGGNPAEATYNGDLKFVGTAAKPVNGLGDKAFYQENNSQMHVLYDGCYFIVAFGNHLNGPADQPENLKIAQRIIENMNKKK